MDPRSAASTYLQDAIENAPPVKVVHMLYQGTLRFLDRAAECDPKDPASEFTHWLTRADAIVCELRLALDQEAAPELSETLERLYIYVEQEVQTALTERELEPVENARNVIAKLYDGWKQLGNDVQ
jgi:flagellar protein FliS